MPVPDAPLNQMHAAALALYDAGCSVVPAMANGTKRPIPTWAKYQAERADPDLIATWFEGGHPGLGVVCGEVSGGLVMLEFEARAVAVHGPARIQQAALAAGAADLWRRVSSGYLESTPSGGLHMLYRIEGGPVPGNQKLARRPGPPDPNTGAPTVEVLAETRGEGGFSIVAPSHGKTHPSGGDWSQLAGGPSTIPTITPEEHQQLCAVMATLDEMPVTSTPPTGGGTSGPGASRSASASAATPRVASTTPADRAPGDLTPGEDYNQRSNWAELLTPFGWQQGRVRPSGVAEWVRPGKSPTEGISATTSYGGDRGDYLYVFSSSTEFEQERPYDRFGAYALLHHRGDHAAAARELRRLGYGGGDWDPNAELAAMIPTGETSTWAPPPAPSTSTSWSPPSTPPGSATPSPASGDASTAATPGASTTPPAPDPETVRRQRLETVAYEELRAREAARTRWAAELAARDWRPLVARTLAEELALPDEPLRFRVDRVMPEGSNTLVTAPFKAGKTTLVSNLVRVLCDGGLFLGKFPVTPMAAGERVAIFNYELSEAQYRRWLRDLGTEHPDRAAVVHLRGVTLPLSQSWAEDAVVAQLVALQARVWVVDPFARAFVGSGEENSNSDVGAFLHTLDRIKDRAGISELVLPAHTGRGEGTGERARGATRLNDWADAQWLLTKDEEGLRYFSATGRDVAVDEEKLTFSHHDRQLIMGGGDRKWQARRVRVDRVVAIVTEQPGITTSALEAAQGGNKAAASAARDEAEHTRLVRVQRNGRQANWFPLATPKP